MKKERSCLYYVLLVALFSISCNSASKKEKSIYVPVDGWVNSDTFRVRVTGKARSSLVTQKERRVFAMEDALIKG